MDTAIEVSEDVGVQTAASSGVSGTPGHHRTLWIGILYAIMIIVVTTFVACLH
jgi:hypothetical protein